MTFIRNNIPQFMLFSAIGAIGTAGHYMTLVLLVELVHTDPTLASFIGAVVGAIINYFLNYRFTFKSSQPHTSAAGKFMLIAAAGAGINTLLMFLFVELLAIYYLLAQVMTTVIVLLWNFLLNKFWTFAEK